MAQGSVYKSVFKNAAYIFFIKLFPAFASVVVLITYSRSLPQADYGAYQDLLIKLLLLGTIAYAGLPVTIITYSADVLKGFMRRLGIVHYSMLAAWLLIWSAVFALFSGSLQLPFLLAMLLLVGYAVHAVQEGLLMAARQMKGLLAVNFLYGFYFLAVHLLVLEDYDLVTLMWYVLAGAMARLVCLMVIVYVVYLKVDTAAPEAAKITATRALWLHLGFYDLMQNLLRFLDKFLLSLFLSSALYAVYFNGSQTAEIPFLPYLLGAVSGSVLIQMSGRDIARSESYKLLNSSGRLLACIVFPLFFFLCFFRAELFTVILTEKYIPSIPIFLMAIMVLPLRAYNYTTMLQHLHQGALINKGVLLDLFIAVALMYPLYRLIGLPGIALAFVVSTYLQVGYYVWHITRLLKLPVFELLPLATWLRQLMLFGVVFYFLHWLLATSLDSRSVLIAGGLFLAFSAVVAVAVEWKALKKQGIISR